MAEVATTAPDPVKEARIAEIAHMFDCEGMTLPPEEMAALRDMQYGRLSGEEYRARKLAEWRDAGWMS